MTKAIIFDMYETLVSCHRAKMYFGEHIAKDLGLEEARFREVWDATDEARTLGKITFEKVIHDIMVQNDVYSDKLYEKILTKRRESKLAFNRYYNKELIPLFDTLKSLNIKLGLISNCYSEEVNPIRECILYPYFDTALLSYEQGIKKPNPEIYLKSAVALGVPAKECIYVGDGAGEELYGARDVGMYPLQATWFFKYNKRRPPEPDPNFKQVDKPMGILKYLA